MIESDVPATGRVKQHAASSTAPQREESVSENSGCQFPRAEKKKKDRSRVANQQQQGKWKMPPPKQGGKNVGKDRELRRRRNENRVCLVKAGIRQFLDTSYVDGAVVSQSGGIHGREAPRA